MKKEYETPEARKVEFDYAENVVASESKLVQGIARCSVTTDVCTGQQKYEWDGNMDYCLHDEPSMNAWVGFGQYKVC